MYRDYGPSQVLPGETLTRKRFRLVLPWQQQQRLETTCFRGYQSLAGNFLLWGNFNEVLNDGIAASVLQERFEYAIKQAAGRAMTFRETLAFPDHIGWASAVTEDDDVFHLIVDRHLELFRPNRHVRAYRVKKSSYDMLPAPLTNFVTIVFTIRTSEEGFPIFFIQTMYPGGDVGQLRPHGRDNLFRGAIFWDWNAPGERLDGCHYEPLEVIVLRQPKTDTPLPALGVL